MLSQVLALINAEMTPIECVEGWQHVAEYDSPPRLIWVPTTDTIAPAVQLGDPRWTSLRTRKASIEAHAWGCSYAQAEAIAHNLIRAAIVVCGGPNVTVGAIKWGRASHTKLGLVAVIPLSVDVPILSEPVAVPTTPADPAVPPDGATQVTIVTADPGEGEAVFACSSTLDPRR